MKNESPVPFIVLLVLYVGLFIALWIFIPIASLLDAMVIGIVLSVSGVAAVITAAFSRSASVQVLAGIGLTGLIAVGIGVYFWITVPEGILDAFILVIGGGVLLAAIAVAGDRLWQGSRKGLKP
ncbi:MAG: hypothetical protein GX898_01380 [Corynebacterium sp.]|uniref:hypothetical protein n=1 Tax=uncultured Corynebacterium sp. TaxID=159447 RepID=UPI00184D2E18|nr:hypothetical protein [uncultured Corynebacterium sp.]NLZ56957.1 hypothetical protein [Corynebacterium sp.]